MISYTNGKCNRCKGILFGICYVYNCKTPCCPKCQIDHAYGLTAYKCSTHHSCSQYDNDSDSYYNSKSNDSDDYKHDSSCSFQLYGGRCKCDL